ncbi:probable disease resistance protein At4g27220 [Momordica charantia]|uniref:Probable disease resistance protein At4g27220 n=1 Tax=Momordica charantia TaxID=3673 RepID=A0A6J1DQJ3_MOMCH|nr:probable disease resistance protein At4g27220 [Momordica charantia]
MDILISVVAKIAEYTVEPIGRQLGYLFFYNRNIKDLEKQLENLKTTGEKVQILVNEEEVIHMKSMTKSRHGCWPKSNVNKVGVYGMGGVGKTKWLDEVKKLVLENKLFDRVIDVTIGQSNGVVEIQDQIGGKLNMGLNMKAETKEGRATFLQNKLVEMRENILILLDDLWNEYDLQKEVGIPCRSESSKEGCKILMTSRSRHILTNNMNTEKCFKVNSLSEEESWKFFMTIVGEFDKNRIEHMAKNVVKKCGGLPIALKIIAKALKGKELRIWKNALEKLEKRVSVKIKGVSDQLYSCLKLSYDWIEDEETRLLFLLCSVFPDDHEICAKDLQMYAMGMGLLNEVDNWETTRNMVIELVDHLKSSSLLLESNSGDNYVQMHDVVRDVAKYIASNENNMSSLSYGCGQSEWREKDRYGSYNAIFVDCMDFPNLPKNLEFPNLQMLILRIQTFFGEGQAIQIPDTFFEGMKKLRVLDMTKMRFESSRTSLTNSLKNLQTLCMSYCECDDILTIFQLKTLEILRINGSTIQELPATMDDLTQLKVLDVSNCSDLEVIPANLISSMTKLEELSLWRSFKRGGEEVSYKNELIKNVKLS